MDERPPLHFAAMYGHDDIVKDLLLKGAEIDKKADYVGAMKVV